LLDRNRLKRLSPEYANSKEVRDAEKLGHSISFFEPVRPAPPLTSARAKTCPGPGCAKPGKKKCAACIQVWYCGVECQRASSRTHKRNCIPKTVDVATKRVRVDVTDPELAAEKKGMHYSTFSMLSSGSSAVSAKTEDVYVARPGFNGNDPFVCKVQVPMQPGPRPRVMLYNHDRSYEQEVSCSAFTSRAQFDELTKLMRTKGV
jgi:hypothetical protein